MTDYGGTWPAMLTPLDEQGEPNLEQLERLTELYVEQEMDGLYVCGSTGQGPLLSAPQRRAVAECVVKTTAGRIPVMVHVGAIATEESVALAEHAARVGADAISSVGPIYYHTSIEETFEHYRRIGAATALPMFVYYLSHLNRHVIEPAEYVERLLRLPNIAGMKITDGNLHQFGLIRSCAGDRLQLFSGADELMCHAALSGACGAIGTFYNVWGPTCRAVRQAFVGGNFALGRHFMLTFQAVIAEVLGREGRTGFLRAAMRMKHGIEIGPHRAPLGIMARIWEEADVERLIAAIDGVLQIAPRAQPPAPCGTTGARQDV